MSTFSFSAAVFADQLLDWYDNHRRVLPWREDPTPYHVWISEIMLQQTQVQTVIPYYTRFLSALPTIAALAEVDTTRLHKLWEGLGYYSRADRLRETAQLLMRDNNGLLPECYEALLPLPGIGPYTAGAIASIAFGERVAAVDGNVLRILSRITAYDGAINVASSAKVLHELAQSLVPAHRPGDFNQALMDLGATICSANGAPHCEICPVAAHCAARAQDLTWLLPIKKAKKPRTIEHHTIILLVCGEKIWIHKRPKKQLLAGLWEFLDVPETFDDTTLFWYLKTLGLTPLSCVDLGKAKHLFTHKEWHMHGWLVTLETVTPLSDGLWVNQTELETTYAIPGALSYYKQQLIHHLL